jgi:hypothetical protein
VDKESVDVSGEALFGSASETTSSHTNQQQLVDGEPLRTSTVELYHNHLPRLQSHEMIEWDQQSHTVSRGDNFTEIEPVLHLMSANSHALPTGLL